jgi:hypothetical protein
MNRYAELHCNNVEVRIKSLAITKLGDWTVTFNYTAEVVAQLKAMIAAYNTAKADGKKMWFEVWIPNSTDAFFLIAQPPQVLSMPEIAQNELLTIDLSFAVEEYKGESTAIEPVG